MIDLPLLRKSLSLKDPKRSLGVMSSEIASKLIAASTDLALVIDQAGLIQDFSVGDVGASRPAYESWLGQPWIDTVTTESRAKVEQLLKDARADRVAVRAREINQVLKEAPEMPFRFSAIGLGEKGRVLAMGRDLRAVAALQQQLVGAQQSMEREYARLRHAETRYRMLFQIISEGVMIAESSTFKLVECNPVAANLLREAPNRLVGRQLPSLFTPETWAEVRDMLSSTQLLSGGSAVSARLAHDGSEVRLSGSIFRNANSSLFLLRMSGPRSDVSPASGRESQTLSVIEGLPDGFVVIDDDRRIVLANAAFVEMAQLAAETQMRGELLDRWLGRPGVDLNILLANLREHGSVRNFATVIRGEYGVSEQVEVSAVSAMDKGKPHVGFVVRLLPARLSLEAEGANAFPRSVDQLTGLVGRVALKEIVRETVDLIERLCIQAALKVSGDNRASAAQILGLSRQSLYSKLHRHGFDESSEEPSA